MGDAFRSMCGVPPGSYRVDLREEAELRDGEDKKRALPPLAAMFRAWSEAIGGVVPMRTPQNQRPFTRR